MSAAWISLKQDKKEYIRSFIGWCMEHVVFYTIKDGSPCSPPIFNSSKGLGRVDSLNQTSNPIINERTILLESDTI